MNISDASRINGMGYREGKKERRGARQHTYFGPGPLPEFPVRPCRADSKPYPWLQRW